MINDVFLTKEHNGQTYKKKIACEIFNDHFENAKQYNIPRAQLIIADIPYNLGNNAYASNPSWYVGGTILMAKVIKLTQVFLKQTRILEYRISLISVQGT